MHAYFRCEISSGTARNDVWWSTHHQFSHRQHPCQHRLFIILYLFFWCQPFFRWHIRVGGMSQNLCCLINDSVINVWVFCWMHLHRKGNVQCLYDILQASYVDWFIFDVSICLLRWILTFQVIWQRDVIKFATLNKHGTSRNQEERKLINKNGLL